MLKFKTPAPDFVNPWLPDSSQNIASLMPEPTLRTGEPAGSVEARVRVPENSEAWPKRTLLLVLPVAVIDPTVGFVSATATS